MKRQVVTICCDNLGQQLEEKGSIISETPALLNWNNGRKSNF